MIQDLNSSEPIKNITFNSTFKKHSIDSEKEEEYEEFDFNKICQKVEEDEINFAFENKESTTNNNNNDNIDNNNYKHNENNSCISGKIFNNIGSNKDIYFIGSSNHFIISNIAKNNESLIHDGKFIISNNDNKNLKSVSAAKEDLNLKDIQFEIETKSIYSDCDSNGKNIINSGQPSKVNSNQLLIEKKVF